MNNLERIIRTVEVKQLQWYGRGDVQYLLSIIEQAEKAFEEINYQFELHEHEVVDNAIKQVDEIATRALQAIRKGD